MKRLFFAASLLILSTQAFAGGSVDFRTDYKRNEYKPASGEAVVTESGFQLSRMKIRFNGNFNEFLTYNTRMNFLSLTGSAAASPTARVTTSPIVFDAIEYAEVTHKMGDMSLTVGKLSDMMSSAFEGQTSTGDSYFQSKAYWYKYAMGLHLDYSLFENHKVALYAFNTDKQDPTTGESSLLTRQGLGVAYKGTLMDKAMGVMFSYHTAPNGEASDLNTNYMSLGVNYKLQDLYVEFDYLNKVATKSATDNSDRTTNSMVLVAKYTLGNFIPFIKYDMSTDSTAANGSNTDKWSQYALGTEFKPKADENFRYHVALVNSTKTPYTGSNTENQTLFLGIRLVADIMK